MPTPIETESNFQDLLLTLSFPSSPRLRLEAIRGFISGLGPDLQSAEPYLLDIVQRLPAVLRQLQPEGISPLELRVTLNSFEKLLMELPVLRSIKGIDEVLDLLRHDLARQFLYVGEVEEAAALFGGKLIVTDPQQETPAVPIGLLEQVLTVAKEQRHPAAARFAEYLHAWKEHLRPRPDRTTFPAVEKPFAGREQRYTGRLRGVSLRLYGEAKNGPDDIHTDVAVLHEGERDFLRPAFAAARSIIADSHPQLAKRFFSGRIQFDELSALHEGASANLAVSVITYCEILRYSNQRLLYKLSARAAFTGGVQDHGEVLSVEPTTLAAKVEAAFFSWLEFLVVPRAQSADAEALVRNLHAVFPKRTLTIVGIGNVRDVFYDRRLSTVVSVNALRHTVRILGRRKPLAAALGLVIILLFVIARLWFGPVDTRPAYVTVSGEILTVRNAWGAAVDTVRIRLKTADAMEHAPAYLKLSVLADVNGDGKKELIWAEISDDRYEETSRVCCKIIGADTLLWRYNVNKQFSFPHKRDAEAGGYGITDLIVEDIDGDGQPEVFFAAQKTMFCSVIVRLNARTGKEINCYLHIGHILDLAVVKLGKTGRSLLLGCGVNNSYSQGCLVVLDPARMGGHSPFQGEYQVDSIPPARELYYMLAPKSSLGAFYNEATDNFSQSVEKEEGGAGIVWSVRRCCSRWPSRSSVALSCSIWTQCFVFGRPVQAMNSMPTDRKRSGRDCYRK